MKNRHKVSGLAALAALLLIPAQAAPAQESATFDAPVRYDTDLLPASFHQSRRAAVLDALPEEGVAVLLSAPTRNRENDISFEYRQNSDLYYLTGTHEPGSALLLAPGGIEIEGESFTEVLMVPPRDPASEVWLGRRFGPERAQHQLGIQKVVTSDLFDPILRMLAERDDVRFFHLSLPDDVSETSALGEQLAVFRDVAKPLEVQGSPQIKTALSIMMSAEFESGFGLLKKIVGNLVRTDLEGSEFLPAYEAFMAGSLDDWLAWRRANLRNYADGTTLRAALSSLRMVKTDPELALLQRAIDITVAAHREAMRSVVPGMHEYEIEALVEYIFRRNGAESPGFPSIVGSGENSVILHYETNRRQLEAEDMIVIDIGAEYHGYSADVTRTLPANGTFSPEQKAIYELVLRAQDAGIDASRAGQPFRAPHIAAAAVVAEGLVELGLIESADEVRSFFMHGTSHYLGLYVHDVGTGGELVPGTVITVEPGVYISPSENVDPKWWNIGVRIEDDILITDGDPVLMSASAPRAVAEIETLMGETGLGNQAGGVVPVADGR